MNELNPFTHLHVHSEYSLCDGGIRIGDLIKKTVARGQKSVALTDHDNLFGAIEFYRKAKDHGIKAIIGAEISIAPISFSKNQDLERFQEFHPGLPIPDNFHLVLLSRNLAGYKNLIKIVSSIYGEEKPTQPNQLFTEYSFLKNRGQGLTALTSCLLGEFAFLTRELHYGLGTALGQDFNPKSFGENTYQHWIWEKIELFFSKLQETFGREYFYIELIDNNLPEQKKLLPDFVVIAKHLNIPIVASADAHYLNAEDAEAHALLSAIKNEMKFNELSNRRQNAEFHLFDAEEFTLKYQRWPEAIANTQVIADSVDLKLDFNTYYLPRYALEHGETEADALRRLAKKGLEDRFVYLSKIYGPSFDEEKKSQYLKRLEYETEVIIKMGFPGYFLIVQDFINWAKEQNIPVGPGRGSGAGSLVAYALKITDLDPIPYNLLFERFLNPERVSMPDFDVDFCQDRRDEVIQYVIKHYGSECVAQITTFGKMLAKAVVKDVGRALEVPYLRVDKLSKLIPNDLGITLKEAYEKEPRIKQESNNDPRIADLLNFAEKLEGLTRHCSVHAAGIVISQGPMSDYVPVYRGEDGGLITHYEKDNVEKVGLVKFDFLGLKTLTVIERAVQLIRSQHNKDFDIALIPLEDPKVYKEISTAHTIGIFQLESTGMQQLIAKLQPSKFEDLVAVVALFRPGPLGSGMVDDFIERKHGRQKIVYPLPQLEPILHETYGIILYQEQVQRIASELAGYSLGEADMLRRAMGKKKPEEMAKQKDRFMQGATANKIDPHTAGDLFELMSKFAEYGFNKSHSAAYGLVSYQTAYLKTYFPEQFMAAIMTCDLDNTDKIIRYVSECKRMGFSILPPSINRSGIEFEVAGPKALIFALGAIKGVGAQSIVPLIEERKKSGNYRSLSDMARRVNLNIVGKKTLELLCSVGCFDEFVNDRSTVFESISSLVKYSHEIHSAKTSGQKSLFSSFDENPSTDEDSEQHTGWELLDVPEDSPSLAANYWLIKEKSLLGVILSSHPLDSFPRDQMLFRMRLSDISSRADLKEPLAVLCFICEVAEKTTKSGKRMYVIDVEDQTQRMELVYFPKDQERDQIKLPEKDQCFVLWLSTEKSFDKSIRIRLHQWMSLEQYRESHVKSLVLSFLEEEIGKSPNNTSKQPQLKSGLTQLQRLLKSHSGGTKLKLQIENREATLVLQPNLPGVKLSNDLVYRLSKLNQSGLNILYQ